MNFENERMKGIIASKDSILRKDLRIYKEVKKQYQLRLILKRNQEEKEKFKKLKNKNGSQCSYKKQNINIINK